MLYQISGDRKSHPLAKLQPTDYPACREAMSRGAAVTCGFDASDFNSDDFNFIDMIESYCVPVFNDKFVKMCKKEKLNEITFHPTKLTWGKENLLSLLDGAVNEFYTAQFQTVDVIDETCTPMKYWPEMKKFRNEDYLIVRDLPENVCIGIDLKRPHIIICSAQFRQMCEAHHIRAAFWELPCRF